MGSYTCQRNPLICGRGYHASQDGTKCVGKAHLLLALAFLASWEWGTRAGESLGLRVHAYLPHRCE